MIETSRQNYKIIAVIIATLGAGLPIWTQSVRDVNFTDLNFLGLWLLIGIISAFVTLFFVNLNLGDMIASFTTGFLIAVVGLFIGGIIINNHIHSQLAISLPLAMITGVISGFSGSTIWKLIKKKKRETK